MTKTLSTILTVFKVARIVAKVILILCLVGCGGCLLGLVTLPLAASVAPGEILDLPSSYLAVTVGLITCAGEAVFSYLAERYFANVLKASTPFTFESAKESFRLGLASIIIAVATSVAAGIVMMIFLIFTPEVSEFDTGISISLSTGLFFLFLSLIFKHGAELGQALSAASAQAHAEEETATKTEAL